MGKPFLMMLIALTMLEGCAKEISMDSPEFQVVCNVGIAAVNLEMAKADYKVKEKGQCSKIIDKGNRYIISGFGTYTHSTLQITSFKDWTVTYLKTKSTPTLGDTSNLNVTFN